MPRKRKSKMDMEEKEVMKVGAAAVLQMCLDDEGDTSLSLNPMALACSMMLLAKEEDERNQEPPPKRTRRYSRCIAPEKEGHPRNSVWFKHYLSEDGQLGRARHLELEFKSRFRVPWNVFVWLRDQARPHFPVKYDCIGVEGAPLELLMMGSLAILGDTVNFENLPDMTNISTQTHRNFFESFMAFGRKVIYPMKVKLPETLPEFCSALSYYQKLGFPGAIGSVDATHVRLWRCPENFHNTSTGKEGFPSRVFQITVDYSTKILHSTKGHFGTWNDKTISKYDDLLI
jgi:hypothetical protein